MKLSPIQARQVKQQLQQASGLLKHGRPEAAIQQLAELPESIPKLNLLSQAQLILLTHPSAYSSAAAQETDQLRQTCTESLKRWSRHVPNDPEPWLRLARLALLQGCFDKAGKRCERALKLDRRLVRAHYLKAIAMQLNGQAGSAALYKAVVRSQSQEPLSKLETALEVAIEQFDTAAGAHHLRFNPAALVPDSEPVDALRRHLESWLEQPGLAPSPRQIRRYADACYNLGVMELAAYDRAEAAGEWFDRCLQVDPDHIQALANSAYALNYRADLEAGTRIGQALEIGKKLTGLAGDPRDLTPPAPKPERPLRVGFLSSDFRSHSVGYFTAGLIEGLAQTEHDLLVYHSSSNHDAITARIEQSATRFLPIAQLNNTALARQIITDRLDILIDLNGYSRGHRAPVLAGRVAPVQISWLGYPASTGLPAMDFRIVDELTDPAGVLTGSESLIRLPRPFLCYEPPPAAFEIDPAARSHPSIERPVTFGCFNHLPKMHQRLIHSWARILHGVPKSRLLLKNAGTAVPDSNRRILADFESQGIGAERIQILDRAPSLADHLRHYLDVDIALDTWPYNGTTTTCEALLMGTPVVALEGDHHAARVSASLLPAVELDRLLADTEAAYVEKAVELASDSDRLRHHHETLRNTFQSSKLMDLNDFVAHYETALYSAWKHRCLQTTP